MGIVIGDNGYSCVNVWVFEGCVSCLCGRVGDFKTVSILVGSKKFPHMVSGKRCRFGFNGVMVSIA